MIIFTLSYIKTLANAFVLGDSLKKFHPSIEFFIGLVDNPNQIPSQLKLPYPIVSVDSINIPNFSDLQAKYNENELLPNCKPMFFEYFLQKSDKVLFFDCPTVISENLKFLETELSENDILLVPQLLVANKHPKENHALNSGVFHSGFIGLKNTQNVSNFLKWWKNHTTQKGYIDLCKGMNADQYCLEITPTLFEKVKIVKHIGLNVGEWNLPEREISEINGKKLVNGVPLVSFNFKGSKYSTEYKKSLESREHKIFEKIQISYGIPIKTLNPVSKILVSILKNINQKIDTFFDLF